MQPDDQLARAIHDSGCRLVLAITGGGSQAISTLLSVPGASRSVLEAIVPYSAEALARWLGARPEQFCSSRTARAMAVAAYQRARLLDAAAARPVGVGCTASLASDRPKRGPHRAYVALQTADSTAVFSLELTKGRRDRAAEEQVVAAMGLNAVAEACGVSERLELGLHGEETVEVQSVQAPPAWQDLMAGRVQKVCVGPERGAEPSHQSSPGGRASVVFPGAFNPLHDGHRRIAELGREMLGAPTQFELSVTNVDKPPLDYLEIDNRSRQFRPDDSLWLTRAATFVEKAAIFPGATFLVGADTIARIAEPRFYGDDSQAAEAAIARILAAGCRFLVFGRMVDGTFRTLGELTLPAQLLAACQEVPAEKFREDVSSTALRNQGES
jgi:nicotinamide mononucleotide (NMN) deamidase PncC